MAAQSFDQLLITRFNALSQAENPSDSSPARMPSLRKSRPPSLKLDIARQAPPASPASPRLPGTSIMTPSFASVDPAPSDPISSDYPGQHGKTPVNQRPRSETVDSYTAILRWRPTYMQSPRLPESPPANCTQQTRSGGQRRESDSCAWQQQQSMEAYLHLPSPEFMAAGHNFGQAPESKDEAPEIPSNKDLI